MRFFVISNDLDTLTGLRFAGIEGVMVEDEGEVREALSACVKDPSVGVILINEKLSSFCPEIVYELKLKSSKTLIVEIPDRYGTGRAPDSITRYIREAIGVKL